MPALDRLAAAENALIGAAIERRERGKHADLLPEDLCAQVIAAARAEAGRIRAWVAKVDAELARLGTELKAAEGAVKAAYVPLPGPVKRVGDVLSAGTRIERQPSTAAVKTPEAVTLRRERVDPLRGRIAALSRERTGRVNELHDLRRIVRLAEAGDITLLNHMTSAWRTRLEIGGAVMGQLPPAARELYARQAQQATPADAAGNPLPPEALDAAGRADMPPMRQRGESLADYSARTGRGKGGG